MKFLTIAVFFSICSSVSAQEGELLAKAKEQQLSNIDKRIGHLNELKTCISGASNREAMQACRATHENQMKSLKEANDSWKEVMKSERKAKREERKKK